MKNTATKNVLFIIGITAAALFLIWAIAGKGKAPNGALSLYFRPDCPHCQKVEKYIANNGLDKKYTIQMKNIDESGQYANELIARSQLCGIATENMGVPLLYDAGTCYVGEEEIIGFFGKKL